MLFLGSFLVTLVLIMLGCCILGWERYGHGLTSRPRESCDHWFLIPLLNFFGYPDGAVTELFNGTLELRYSSTPFSKKLPSWSVSTHPVVPVGVPGSGSRVHFPDHDPVVQHPAKRFRHHWQEFRSKA